MFNRESTFASLCVRVCARLRGCVSGLAHVVMSKDIQKCSLFLQSGIRMRSGMRMRTHRMREILVNADKDANASDRI